MPSRRVRVGGDLDALDRAALVGRVVERDRLDEVGVLARQPLHRLGVVEQAAVAWSGRWAARRRRWRRRTPRRRGGRARLWTVRSGICVTYWKPASRSLRASAAPCSTTSRKPAPPCSVTSRPEFASCCARARVGVETRTSDERLRADGGQALGGDRQVRAAGAAGHPARLHGQRARGGHEAGRQLAAAAVGRAGHQPAGQPCRRRPGPSRRRRRRAARSRCPPRSP